MRSHPPQTSPTTGEAVVYSEASVGQRAKVYLLDLTVWGALVALVQSILIELDSKLSLGAAALIVYLAYFVVAPARAGQTLGKWMAGLKVVPSGLSQAQTSAWIFRLLIRETVGRAVAFAFFGIGFLVAFSRPDRRGWHEQISGTRVDTVDAVPSVGSWLRPLAWWGGSALTTVCIVHQVAYSPLLLRTALEEVRTRALVPDLEIGRVRGGFMNGFEIDRVSFKSPIGRTEWEEARFRVRVTLEPGEIRVEFRGVSAKEARLYVLGQPRRFAIEILESLKAFFERGLATDLPEGFPPIVFVIGEADVSNLSVVSLDQPTVAALVADRFMIERAVYSPLQATATATRVYLSSSMIDVDLRDVSLESALVRLASPTRILVKPELVPRWIRRPIDVQLQGRINRGKWQELTVDAFRGTVHAEANGVTGEIQAKQWTVSHYFNVDAPLYNLDLIAKGTLSPLRAKSLEGTVSWRSTRMKIDRDWTMSVLRDGRTYRIGVRPSLWASLSPSLRGAFFLRSGFADALDAREELSKMIFERSRADLNSDWLRYVDADAAYFEPPTSSPAPDVESVERAPSEDSMVDPSDASSIESRDSDVN